VRTGRKYLYKNYCGYYLNLTVYFLHQQSNLDLGLVVDILHRVSHNSLVGDLLSLSSAQVPTRQSTVAELNLAPSRRVRVVDVTADAQTVGQVAAEHLDGVDVFLCVLDVGAQAFDFLLVARVLLEHIDSVLQLLGQRLADLGVERLERLTAHDAVGGQVDHLHAHDRVRVAVRLRVVGRVTIATVQVRVFAAAVVPMGDVQRPLVLLVGVAFLTDEVTVGIDFTTVSARVVADREVKVAERVRDALVVAVVFVGAGHGSVWAGPWVWDSGVCHVGVHRILGRVRLSH